MEKVKIKLDERDAKISQLSRDLSNSSNRDEYILKLPLAELHKQVSERRITPLTVWETYTRQALECHSKTNCITEFISFKDSGSSSAKSISQPQKKPLEGVPVSIKDNFGIGGYDASMGFPGKCKKPLETNSALIKLLVDAGAILYVKTNVPTGMMSILSSNAVWGTTSNPHDTTRSPGGSSSGEGALIGGGGSRVGIGTDIGGSVRVPAHFCGIYSLRMSGRRFPRAWLEDSSTPGFEGIPDVASPLAKSMEDLEFFVNGVMSMKPWLYCYDILPIPWRHEPVHLEQNDKQNKIRTVGILRSDGLLEPTPAVERALDLVINVLRSAGTEIRDFKLPQPGSVYDKAYAALLLADGFETVAKPLVKGEHPDTVLATVRYYAWLPKWLRSIIEWFISNVCGQKELADDLHQIGPQSVTSYYEKVVFREQLRRQFWEAWKESGVDILITPPFPSPAPPVHNFIPDSACNYTAIFNLLDYPSGVIPVTTVDRNKDKLPNNLDASKFNWQTQSYFDVYDANAMHGLPVGVQIVGQRLQDEKVLYAMGYIDRLLRAYSMPGNQETSV